MKIFLLRKKYGFGLQVYMFALLVLLFNSSSSAQIIARAEASLCSPNIMSYYFGVENLTIPNQVSTLSRLKMNGVMVRIDRNNLADLDAYYATPEVKNGSFHVYDIWTTINVASNDAKLTTEYATLESIYAKIQNKETILQVIFGGNASKERITQIVSATADIAKKYGKDLIIYPHFGHTIATSEIALSYIKLAKKSNVFLAIHLCHELRAGFGNRMNEVVQNVAPYIKSASISGATLSEMLDPNLPNWKWGIKPLYMGTYDLSSYYNALHSIGYKGPIAIHTWGIINNFGLYSQDHLPRSRNKLIQLANKACLTTHYEPNEDILPSDQYILYPNPSKNGIFTLSEESVWKVVSITGEELISGKGNQINISSYPKGVYLVKINNKIERVIVE